MALVVGTNCGLCTSAPSADPAGSNYTIDDYGRAVRIVVGATPITITEIGFYVDNATEEANFEVGLYSDNADVPGSLLQSEKTNAKGTTSGWKKKTGLSWDLDASTTYWLAVQCDNTATQTSINYGSIAGQRYSYNTSMATLPATWSASGTSDNTMMAIYGVYEETGGAEGTATNPDTFDLFSTITIIIIIIAVLGIGLYFLNKKRQGMTSMMPSINIHFKK